MELEKRSLEQTRYFHALVEAVYDNLPDSVTPEWGSWRILKGWLLIRAGHCEEWRFEPGAMTHDVARMMRLKFDIVEIVELKKSHQIIVRFPKSIRELNQDQMSMLVDKVKLIIARDVLPGVDLDGLMEEAKRAA